jgi:hypothetical protein
MGARSLVSIADKYSPNPTQISVDATRWDEKAGLERDALSSQVIDALDVRETRRPAMKKLTTTMMQHCQILQQL